MRRPTNEEVLKDVLRVRALIGRPVKVPDYEKYGKFTVYVAVSQLGSLHHIGSDGTTASRIRKAIKYTCERCNKDFYRYMANKKYRFCSQSCIASYSNALRPNTISETDIIQDIRDIQKKLGIKRINFNRYVKAGGKFSLAIIRKRLGTWIKACKKALPNFKCKGELESFVCAYCGETRQKPFHQIKRQKNNFCNITCLNRYSVKFRRRQGHCRSKLELWMERNLNLRYPNLEILYNNREVIGLELDIYIPSLKIAVELNGIFHYEPIYGQETLDRTRERDSNRFLECQKRGISLCVIDVSKMKYFKEVHAPSFLKIITDIIDQAKCCLSPK